MYHGCVRLGGGNDGQLKAYFELTIGHNDTQALIVEKLISAPKLITDLHRLDYISSYI